MVELWVLLTIAAAFLQNLRSVLQKRLSGSVGDGGATYVRFAFGFPIATCWVLGLALVAELPLPAPNGRFLGFASLGGIAQILGTWSLIAAFRHRNFAVGTALSKTETVQTALVALIILGEPVSVAAAIGILVSFGGVLLLTLKQGGPSWNGLLEGWAGPAARLGIASGACFAVAAVSYRAAALSLGGEGFLMQAAFTLMIVTIIQTLVMTIYFGVRDRATLRATLTGWRSASLVGLVGVVASIGWFTAMTIENVALVRAVGQVELLFSFAAGAWLFGERTTRAEIGGVALVSLGLVLIVMGR